MKRFLALLIAFALTVNTGAAAALAMCQHRDSQAHAAALKSDESSVASAAILEDMAERAASGAGAMADQPNVLVGAFMIPAAIRPPVEAGRASELFAPREQLEPPSRSVDPPERPPLA